MDDKQKKMIEVMSTFSEKYRGDNKDKIREFVADFFDEICELMEYIKNNEQYIKDADAVKKYDEDKDTFKQYKQEKDAFIRFKNEKEKQKEFPNKKSEISKELDALFKSMKFWNWNPFTHFRRNNPVFTEGYYHQLLPYADAIEYWIPGFSRSWSNNRRSFDGMRGLVIAANNLLSIK